MSADTCQPSDQSTGTLIVTGVVRRIPQPWWDLRKMVQISGAGLSPS